MGCHAKVLTSSFPLLLSMQQLYRCFSWWRAHPDKDAVLVTGQNVNWAGDVEFVKGYTELLRAAINLTVVEEYKSTETNPSSGMVVRSKDTGKWPHDIEITDFALLDPDRELSQFVQDYVPEQGRPHPSVVEKRTESCNNADQLFPRISILNRPHWASRHLANAPEIQDMVQAKLLPVANQTVPIVTFHDYTPFAEQFWLFRDTDVLISPHGAQLLGMTFLPSCASVLEVFPHRYLVAEYFGTLAAALNLDHGYVYVGDPDEDIPHAERFHYMRDDNHKGQSLEPNVKKISSAVDSIIKKWRKCICGHEE
jgi:Glycosyltransferase 61